MIQSVEGKTHFPTNSSTDVGQTIWPRKNDPLIQNLILISSGESSVVNESQDAEEDGKRAEEAHMLEGSHHVISLVGKGPGKIMLFSRCYT